MLREIMKMCTMYDIIPFSHGHYQVNQVADCCIFECLKILVINYVTG